MAHSTAFNLLPIELNQNIAWYIGSDDKDVATFRLICKSTNDAIDADGGAFWRRRFFETFEPHTFKLTDRRKEDGDKFRNEYQARKQMLHVIDQEFQKQGAKPKLQFDMGAAKREKIALRVLRDLIVESFGKKRGVKDVGYESQNMKYILDFVQKNNILQILGRDVDRQVLRTRETCLLYTIQVLLTPALLSFDKWHMGHHSEFHAAQIAAYADNLTAPILTGYTGMDVNMTWLLRNIQFWRHHFLVDQEPLCPAYEALEDYERPQFWSNQLSQEPQKIGKQWRGTYAFVDRPEIRTIRMGRSGQLNYKNIIDQLNGEEDPDNAFQSIELEPCGPSHPIAWRQDFEQILRSRLVPTNTARTCAQHGSGSTANLGPSTRFEGEGVDNEEFFVDGWLNPLPTQYGVPGWHRVTMMKYFEENGVVDTAALWAYEGILLPGGKIMVGRWWCPTDGTGNNMYSGPFLLWCTDGPTDDDSDDEDENDEDDDDECDGEKK